MVRAIRMSKLSLRFGGVDGAAFDEQIVSAAVLGDGAADAEFQVMIAAGDGAFHARELLIGKDEHRRIAEGRAVGVEREFPLLRLFVSGETAEAIDQVRSFAEGFDRRGGG